MVANGGIDEVRRNAIWTEHCVREGKTLKFSEGFGGIRSPSKMVAIPEKPNRMRAVARPSPQELQAARDLLTDMSILKNEDKLPAQLFDLPLTLNQAYGFFQAGAPLVERNALWHRPKAGCDVTNYADAYCTMTGASPYSNSKPSA